MRKVIYSIAGALFIGIPALFAQNAKTASSYSTQELQTLLVQLRDSTQKDKYAFAKELIPLEKFATSSVSANVAEKALANYSLAYLYAMYLKGTSYNLKPFNAQQGGDAPLLPYTKEQIKQRIDWAIEASLKDKEELALVPVKDFPELIKNVQTNSILPDVYTSLYEFLLTQSIELLKQTNTDQKQIISLYDQLITFEKNRPGDRSALIESELSRIDYIYNNSKDNEQSEKDRYMRDLDKLITTYENDPYIVVAIAQKALAINPQTHTDSKDWIKQVYTLCTQTIARYSTNRNIVLIEKILNQITNPYITARVPQQLYPNHSTDVEFSYRNVDSIHVCIEQLFLDDNALRSFNKIDTTAIAKKVIVSEKQISFPELSPYKDGKYTIPFALKHEGYYQITISNAAKDLKKSSFFTVSKIASVLRPGNDKQTGEVIAVDWLTGKPLRNALVMLYKEKNMGTRLSSVENKGSVQTDRYGVASFFYDENDINCYRVTDGKSYVSFLNRLDRYYGYDDYQAEMTQRINIFTDKAVYRPGQTVSFKGIAYESNQMNANVLKGKQGELTVTDVNGSKIYTYAYTTNPMGGFSGSFALPTDMLNGFVILHTPDGSTSIQVEAYKRPNFYIQLKPDTSVYEAGDSIYVTGQVLAYNGVTMPDCAIHYQVDRMSMARYISPEKEDANIAAGTLQTDEAGNFKIALKTKKEDAKDYGLFFWPRAVWYNFNIQATDMAGETQTADTRIAVGKNALHVDVDIPDLIDKERIPESIVYITNANGELISANGTITIQRVISTEQFDHYTKLVNDRQNDSTIVVEKPILQTLQFASGEALNLSSLADLKSGCYQLTIEAKAPNGLVAHEVRRVMVYNMKDELPPANLKTWTVSMNTTVRPNKSTWITFGTSLKDVHLLYEVVANGVCLKRDRLTLSKENQRFVIPYTAEMGNGAVVYLTFIKEGKAYQETVVIKRQQPDKNLSVKFESFTDKTVPGAELTYTVRVQNPDSTASEASVLAGMYDSALDVFAINSWSLTPLHAINIYPKRLSDGSMFGSSYLTTYGKIPNYSDYNRANWQFDWKSYFTPNIIGYRNLFTMATRTNELAKSSKFMMVESFALAEEEIGIASASRSTVQNTLRTNLLETAFFYPDLRTDKKGEVSFSFKIPDVNTRWKLMLLANTSSMNVGSKVEYIVSSKQLMVQPNWPRFVRSGDLVDLSATVINNTVDNLSGKTTLQVTDESGNVLKTIDVIGQTFDLKGKTSQVATWQLRIPQGTNFLIFKTIADSKSYSDGEQVIIPVVPNDYSVTASKQVTLKAGTSMQLSFSDLLKKTKKLPNGIATVEVINNPAWMAIEVLPYLQAREDDNAISLLGSFFAGKTAMHLIDFVPGVKSRLAQLGASTAEMKMQTNLEKGALLANMNLQATPWLNQSNRELQQRLALKSLLNRNMLTANSNSAMQKLIALQNENGSISWFDKMPGNVTVTSMILYGMGNLVNLNAVEYGEAEKMMQIKALNYLDGWVKKCYERIKNQSDYTLNSDILFYLYVRSMYRDIPELGDAREAIRFFTSKAEQNWTTRSVDDKAMIALLMHANGKSNLAQAIAQNLVTIATKSNSLGMYWNNPMYSSTIGFASAISIHVLAMNALQSATPEVFEQNKNGLITWLIRQKEVQQWNTTPSTLSAIYAILTSCSFSEKQSRIELKWGDKSYIFTEEGNQTGVMRSQIQGERDDSSANRISLKNIGNNIAWVNLFYQYNVPVSDIQKNHTELSIEKELFVKRVVNNRTELIPIAKAGVIKNGDVIATKLEVSTDRTLNFVCIRDWRSGCLEPISTQSGYQFTGSFGYYLDIKDLYSNIFISTLPAGKQVIWLESFVSRQGNYLAAPASIESVYAPRLVNYSQGLPIDTDMK